MKQHKWPSIKSESDLEGAAVDFAELYMILCYKFVSPGNAGVMDHIFIFPGSGETVYVEFKKPGADEELKPMQEYQAKRISENGAAVYECDSTEGFERIVERHLER